MLILSHCISIKCGPWMMMLLMFPLDEIPATTFEFASSKDTPVQRTRITTWKIISEEVTTTTRTGTKTTTLTVSNVTTSTDSALLTSNSTSVIETTATSTNVDAPVINNSNSNSLSAGGVAAVVFGVLTGLAVIGSFIWWLWRKRMAQKEEDEARSRILNPEHRSFSLLNQPQLAELEHTTHDLQTPEPAHWTTPGTPENSRISSWTGTQFSTPRPAIAEVRSYRRAGQRPRVFDVSGPISELPTGSNTAHAAPESYKMAPMSRPADENFVSPVSPSPHPRPTLPWNVGDEDPAMCARKKAWRRSS